MTALINCIIIFSLFFSSFAQDETEKELSDAQIWGFGILTGIAVSMIGFLAAIALVALRKCMSDETFKMFIQVFYALGCGALIGDSIVHILPEAFKS